MMVRQFRQLTDRSSIGGFFSPLGITSICWSARPTGFAGLCPDSPVAPDGAARIRELLAGQARPAGFDSALAASDNSISYLIKSAPAGHGGTWLSQEVLKSTFLKHSQRTQTSNTQQENYGLFNSDNPDRPIVLIQCVCRVQVPVCDMKLHSDRFSRFSSLSGICTAM